MVSGIGQESREWFEDLCEEGFDRAFEQLFGLYSELRKCDARDTDVMGKIESGVGDGSLYHAVEIVGEDETEYMPSENELAYSLYAKRISAGQAGINSGLSEKSFTRRKGLPIMK